uniref:Uncharacterized protein n=1 Tax=Anopheles farauti TaxID=69004 RepID=A0A182QEL2_9DIPT
MAAISARKLRPCLSQISIAIDNDKWAASSAEPDWHEETLNSLLTNGHSSWCDCVTKIGNVYWWAAIAPKQFGAAYASCVGVTGMVNGHMYVQREHPRTVFVI